MSNNAQSIYSGISIMAISLKRHTAYRIDTILMVLSNLSFPVIMAIVWGAAYYTTGTTSIGPYSLSNLVLYYFTMMIVGKFVLKDLMWMIDYDVTNGQIIRYLVRPFGYLPSNFAEAIADVSFYFAVIGVPLFVVAYFAIGINISAMQVALLAVEALIAFAISFALYSSFGCISFFMPNSPGIYSMVEVAVDLFAGAFVPLSMLPGNVFGILQLLPFQFFYNLPGETMTGTLSTSAIIAQLPIGLFWIAILFAVLFFVWTAARKRINTVGV
ncbi:MAG: ABC-2 family transporter protein [Candidatus Marsarchaeota archaeon]|nr:ABC-2 family transporter protein [Candidatus Marsarchaeota archaeon]